MKLPLLLAQDDPISRNVELWKLVIGWCFVGIIVCTAIISLISLVRPLIVPDAKMRRWLYKSLLGELIVIAAGMFSGLLKVNTVAQKEAIKSGEADLVQKAKEAHEVAKDATNALNEVKESAAKINNQSQTSILSQDLTKLNDQISKHVNRIQSKLSHH